ncbi:MAG: nucleoside deaminase [Kofleriaceae bacterium]
MSQHDEWMAVALEEARAAGAAGDVPVGCVIVSAGGAGSDGDGQEIARGRNRREVDGDPTAHAEIVALRSAAKVLGTWRVEATLYVTQEPCPMCAGAIVNARVASVVFGCTNPKAGAVQTLYQIASDVRLNHRATVIGGVRDVECAAELSQFFARLRRGPSFNE